MKKQFKIVLAIVVLMGVISTAFYLESRADGNRLSKPMTIKILDKTFVLPIGFLYHSYGVTHGGYEQLEFTLDVNTFKTITADYTKDNNLTIELRPLSSEWGEKNYWTDKDPIYQSKEINCNDYIHAGTTYEICEQSDKPSLASGTRNKMRSIKEKNTGEYISMYGCFQKSCNARSRILDSLQTEYHYRVEYFSRAVELEFALRDLVESMRQPSAEGKTP